MDREDRKSRQSSKKSETQPRTSGGYGGLYWASAEDKRVVGRLGASVYCLICHLWGILLPGSLIRQSITPPWKRRQLSCIPRLTTAFMSFKKVKRHWLLTQCVLSLWVFSCFSLFFLILNLGTNLDRSGSPKLIFCLVLIWDPLVLELVHIVLSVVF